MGWKITNNERFSKMHHKKRFNEVKSIYQIYLSNFRQFLKCIHKNVYLGIYRYSLLSGFSLKIDIFELKSKSYNPFIDNNRAQPKI